MSAVGLESRRASEDFFFGMVIHGKNSFDRRMAVSERAGLVESDALEVRRCFELSAALDQNAVAGGGREPGDDADRSGDDQRAGAGDNQDHQGLVQPGPPAFGPQERRKYRNEEGQDHHGWRVGSSEAIHPLFNGGSPGLGFFHHMDDMGQGRVRCRPGGAKHDGGLPIDGDGVYFIPPPARKRVGIFR